MALLPHHLQLKNNRLSVEDSIALLYHDIFEFPLKSFELAKWRPGRKMKLRVGRPKVEFSEGYFVINNKSEYIKSRIDKEVASRKKLKALASAKTVLEKNKNILMVAITGSLAMAAAEDSSDIDLLVITKAGKLWSTRLGVLLALMKSNIRTRKAGDKEEKDKLCLNIWLDERNLEIISKDPYSAHELAQIIPVINRGDVYEKLIAINKWILDYWPNAIEVKNSQYELENRRLMPINWAKEKLAYLLQIAYMGRKRTREVVTPTRAFFHPVDWIKRMERELNARGVVYD